MRARIYNFTYQEARLHRMQAIGKIAKLVVVVLCAASLLPGHAVAVAPGDESDDCEVPDYPVNIRVLLDSWRYQTLLPPENDDTTTNAVWTTHTTKDKDNTWYSTGVCKSSAVRVCGSNEDEEQQWLHTQYINKSLPAPDVYPVRVFVNISYFFTDCSAGTSGCSSHIELLRFEDYASPSTNYMPTGDEIMPDNHLQDDMAMNRQQFYIDLYALEDFGNISLVAYSLSVCVTVSRILVYHYECPYQNVGLTHLSATQAPVSGSVSIWPQCAHNSHDIRDHSVVECSTEGEWSDELVSDNCECDEEYFEFDNRCILKPVFTPEMETYSVEETQNERRVCFNASGFTNHLMPTQTIRMRIETRDGTAIKNFDYVPINTTVSFTSKKKQCVDIQIVNNELTEEERHFTVELWHADVMLSSAEVIIKSNTSSMLSCTEGSVAVVSDVNNSSLQLVEMCSNDGVWSPVCDYDWTLKDAMVVCRELGYSSLGDMKVLDAVEGSSDMIPVCSGTETSLSSCLLSVPQSTECDYLLVECSQKLSPSPTDTSESSGGGIPTAVIAGIAGMMAVIIALVLLVTLLIVILLKKNKKSPPPTTLAIKPHTEELDLCNPVYDPSAGIVGEDKGKQEDELSYKFRNPLYAECAIHPPEASNNRITTPDAQTRVEHSNKDVPSQPALVYDYVRIPISSSSLPKHEYHYLECPDELPQDAQ